MPTHTHLYLPIPTHTHPSIHPSIHAYIQGAPPFLYSCSAAPLLCTLHRVVLGQQSTPLHIHQSIQPSIGPCIHTLIHAHIHEATKLSTHPSIHPSILGLCWAILAQCWAALTSSGGYSGQHGDNLLSIVGHALAHLAKQTLLEHRKSGPWSQVSVFGGLVSGSKKSKPLACQAPFP